MWQQLLIISPCLICCRPQQVVLKRMTALLTHLILLLRLVLLLLLQLLQLLLRLVLLLLLCLLLCLLLHWQYWGHAPASQGVSSCDLQL
jgi:hypothetical protein